MITVSKRVLLIPLVFALVIAMMLGHALLAVIKVSESLWRLIKPLPERRHYRCLTIYLQAAEWEEKQRISRARAGSTVLPPRGASPCDD